MMIKSFFSKEGRLQPLEVEVTLMPGLPTLQVIGLPDTALKESALRIKAALTAQGFQWPKAKQVVVNLRPTHLRKHSKGLELAIVVAFLLETGQIPRENLKFPLFAYGELGLEGQVRAPLDLESVRACLKEEDLMVCAAGGNLHHPLKLELETLADLLAPVQTLEGSGEKFLDKWMPRKIPDLSFPESQAHLLAVAALSGAATLLAGPPGSGKTTFAESLYFLLPRLKETELFDLRAHHLQLGEELKDRPLVAPHHSTPVMSLIGGGNQAFPGEVAKAHGGLLILDEFLLFPARVIEALREPLVSKKFRVARLGRSVTWPADFQFVATTNLCPCGRLTAKKDFRCVYTLPRCQSIWTKLSGPMLDRFELVVLFEAYGKETWKEERSSLREINERVEKARALYEGLLAEEKTLVVPEVFRTFQSRRREMALKKLSVALAALEGTRGVEDRHWLGAYRLSQRPVKTLQELFS
jgi:magnesium chelatase family protein